jgi:hypothetical protein
MEKGRIRFGAAMIGTFLHTEHEVEPDQREPGLPDEQQPRRHIIDMGVMEWDLDAQIGLHRRFAFEAFLPIRANVIRADFDDANGRRLPADLESIHHRDETIAGVGDLLLGARIGLVRPENVRRWILDLRLGLSQPTGKTEPNPFTLGAQGLEHQHMFFGSGTFDPLVGLETQAIFQKWRLVGWAQARVPLYANRHGYRDSRTFVAGLGAQTGFGLERWGFLLQPEVYVETPALWEGRPARNSGRVSLLGAGGVFVSVTERWLVHALVKVPVFTRAHGGQLRWPAVGILGFSYTFDLRR